MTSEKTTKGIETKTKFYFDKGKDGKVDAIILIDGAIKSKEQAELLKLDLTERDLKTLTDKAEMPQINPDRSAADRRTVFFFNHGKNEASVVDFENRSTATAKNQDAKKMIQSAQVLYSNTLQDIIDGDK